MISLTWVLDFSYLFILFLLLQQTWWSLWREFLHFSHYYLFSSISGLIIFRDIRFRSLLLCAIRQSYVTLEKIDKNTFSSSSFISHQSRFSLILLHMYSFSPRWHKTADKYGQNVWESLRWISLRAWERCDDWSCQFGGCWLPVIYIGCLTTGATAILVKS